MKALSIAIIGAGPVGLALALLAARQLPQAQITLFDSRAADHDLSGDGRTLALAIGSIQLLQRIGAWQDVHAEPISEVWISQQAPALAAPGWLGTPEVRLSAIDLAVPMLGAVLGYGALVAPMQRAWEAAAAAAPARLHSRFSAAVTALKELPDGVEVDAGVAERFDLAVVAEGGVFGERRIADLQRDYRQNAWVGSVTLSGGTRGLAVERFTRDGPAALLPLPPAADRPGQRASLVWCVPRDDDPVRELDDAQRLAVLNTVFDRRVGRIESVSALKCFALGLAAQRSLVRGRTVRIGNAAQTLHPVAGQGLNLGLRDAAVLARMLAMDATSLTVQRYAAERRRDRGATIRITDTMARIFASAPDGAVSQDLLGLSLGLVDTVRPLKRALAEQLMFGRR